MGWEVGEEGSEIVTDVYRHKCIYGCLLTAKRCVVFVLLLLLCVCVVLFVLFVCLFCFGGVCLFVCFLHKFLLVQLADTYHLCEDFFLKGKKKKK